MKRFSGDRDSKTVYQYLKVGSFSFDKFEHVHEYHLYHILNAFKAFLIPNSTLDDILSIPLFDTNTYILAYYMSISLIYKELV